MPPNKIGGRRAGEGGREQFRAMRRQALKRNWRDVATLSLIVAASIAVLAFFHGVPQLVGAFMLGVSSMLAVFIWIIGGDVWSLPPAWGAIGEEQTGDALERLDSSWWVEHDIPHSYGNYDHIVIGPPGVFLLDTKRLSRAAVVRDDELRAGGMRYSGTAFRRAAVTVADALGATLGARPWVQSVVVVWGTLGHQAREEARVIYLQGDNLISWLESQPTRVTNERCKALAEAVLVLRESAALDASRRRRSHAAAQTTYLEEESRPR
jgi:hypothetical protein